MDAINWDHLLSIGEAIISESDALESAQWDAGRGFDLLSELPLRVRLDQVGADKWVLSIVMHHIASDGESVAPLLADISAAYEAAATGEPLPDLPIRYRDYTLWNHKYLGDVGNPDSRGSQQLAFWVDRLAELPQEMPLPHDRQRPADPKQTGSVVRVPVPDDVRRGLEALASPEPNEACSRLCMHCSARSSTN